MGKDDIWVGKVTRVQDGLIFLRCYPGAPQNWFVLPAELLWDAEDLINKLAYIVTYDVNSKANTKADESMQRRRKDPLRVAEICEWRDDLPRQVFDPLAVTSQGEPHATIR